MPSDKEMERRRLRMYFAAPLFSAAELQFNRQVADALAQVGDVYLPQRDGGLLVRMVQSGIPAAIAARRVFSQDVAAIRECDVLLALLDGRTVDEGVAFELGVAYSMGKRCLGLQTDVRRLLPTGNNPMIDEALSATYINVEELVESLKVAGDEGYGHSFARLGDVAM